MGGSSGGTRPSLCLPSHFRAEWQFSRLSNCGFRRLSLLISVRHARVGLLGVAASLIPLRKSVGFSEQSTVLKMSHSTGARQNLINRFVDN